MKLKMTGITRKKEFSPNHQKNDLLIIKKTAAILSGMGAEVNLIDESRIGSERIDGKIIFSMARGAEANRILMDPRFKNSLILNDPRSILDCYRTRLAALLPAAGVPFPKSKIIVTENYLNGLLGEFDAERLWIKRSDFHGRTGEVDVVPVKAVHEEILPVLQSFRLKGMDNVIIQENVTGDVVKFYAVRDMDYFHWYYTEEVHKTSFNEGLLKNIADRSARALGLYIYGGDAIIKQDGSVVVIDINDWPSFAPVRDDAASFIARLIFRKAEEFMSDNGRSDAHKYKNVREHNIRS